MPCRSRRLLLVLLAALLTAVTVVALHAPRPAAAQSGAPGTPSLVAPANGYQGLSPTGTLSWTQPSGAIPGTTQYNVFPFDWDTNQDLPTLTTSNTSLAVPASEALQPGHRYFWDVNACNGSNCSAVSGDWQFFVQPPAGAPFFVQQVSAQGGTTPTFNWNPPTGSTSGSTLYVVALIDDATGTFLNTLAPTTDLKGCTRPAGTLCTTAPPSEGLVAGHTYDWAVNACNGALCSHLGNWWTYTTSASPGTPLQASPANGATGQSTTLTLAWTAPQGAISGVTQYYVDLEDPYGEPAGHLLGQLAPTTNLSISVPASCQCREGIP